MHTKADFKILSECFIHRMLKKVIKNVGCFMSHKKKLRDSLITLLDVAEFFLTHCFID